MFLCNFFSPSTSAFRFPPLSSSLVHPLTNPSPDGVAPRAKLNQQRSRRFMSARESTITRTLSEGILTEMRADGWEIPDDVARIAAPTFDSNVITPVW